MTGLPENYARVLFEMNTEKDDIETARSLLTESDELREALISPIVTKADKRKVIDMLFPVSVRNFVKVMSDNGCVEYSEHIFEAYDALARERDNVVLAEFIYVTAPDEEQIEKLKKKIAKDHGKQNVELRLVEDRSIIGGFILKIGDLVLDRSVKTSIRRLRHQFAER